MDCPAEGDVGEGAAGGDDGLACRPSQDGRWGRFGDKLHKLALMQGQLETDYDEETKTLYLLSVRGDLSEGL